jgi:hypothetical protein
MVWALAWTAAPVIRMSTTGQRRRMVTSGAGDDSDERDAIQSKGAK